MHLNPHISIAACPGVYPPSDDSYLLLSAIRVKPGQEILDMGTGTGIIGLHCAAAGCRVVAVDISLAAVNCAGKNALANGLDMHVARTDLFSGIRGRFDIIAFNPPYLAPAGGLDPETEGQIVGGAQGHELSTRFLDQAAGHLKPGGSIYLLTSSETADRVLEHASRGYAAATVASRRQFFEVLAVHRLVPSDRNP